MLTPEQCRKIDPALADLSDDELRVVCDQLYDIANVAIGSFTKKRGVPNIPFGLLSKKDRLRSMGIYERPKKI